MSRSKTIKCPLCNGKGTQHLHGAAIPASEFNEDPDFAESYLRGDYEHACDHCGGDGLTTVDVWEMRQEQQAEMRMGA